MTQITPPLRLALVANRIQRNDGQGRVNYEIARAALACGMHVTLLAAHCADDISSHPNARYVRLGRESRPTQMWRNLAFANDTARWLRANRGSVDIVQANGFITWEPCDIVAMHFVHSSWLRSRFYPFKGSLRPYALYQRAYTVLNGRWEKRAVHSGKKIVAVSDVVAHDVQELGVPADKIETIFNGVDVEEFRPGPSERNLWNLPESVPIALFVGDIRSPRKNVATVLRALRHLPTVHLAVAGDTKSSPAPALANQLGIAERVHFVGKTSKIPSLMRSVDLFVFPSRYEAHPLVILEAMASGLPVVVSKNVGSAGTFGDVLEVLDTPDDAELLAGLMKRLLHDPGLRKDMGQKARTRALDLSWDKTTAAYLSLYKDMAEHKRTISTGAVALTA